MRVIRMVPAPAPALPALVLAVAALAASIPAAGADAASPVASTAVSSRTDPLGGTGGGPIAGSLQVRVVQQGTGDALPGAFVMVGPREDDPFPGNWGFTSAAGEIDFADPLLQGPVCVTAAAEGYTFLTLPRVDAADLVLPLHPAVAAPADVQVGDYVSGIDVNNGSFNYGDGYLDMAFVVPALRIESLMAFETSALLGPPETIEILGQPFEVPSNVFLPSQYELFIQIVKDHYYLYLAPGDYTLTAMSGRLPRDALLQAGDIAEIIPQIAWREIDVRDVTVSEPTMEADLFVDPDLATTVTLQLANLPENSLTWCFSAGDLDGLDGLGRLVPLGLSSFDCPGGAGPCGGTVQLTTTAASGEFAGLSYFPAVVVDLDATEDALILLARGPHPQTYTETMASFFRELDLAYDGAFSWNDAENPQSGSPAVDVQVARLVEPDGSRAHWEFMLPGGELAFTPPVLPAAAPAGPQTGSACTWEQAAMGLGYGLPAFDFDAFAFADIVAHVSHVASDRLGIVLTADPAAVAADGRSPAPGAAVGLPTPFHAETRLAYEMPSPGFVELAVFTPEGRRVRTLERGHLAAGRHAVVWDGTSSSGERLPAGLYLARLEAPGLERTWRLILQR